MRKTTPRLNLAEEVTGGRKDYGDWMRRQEPRGFRAGTQGFRDHVTVVRERAGEMAAADDRRRLGDEEFERRFAERRARFGGGAAAAAEGRRDSGVASVGDEVGDEVDEEDVVILGEERPEGMDSEDVVIVGEEGPKRVAFSMRELERRLEKKGDGSGAKVGRGTPPTRGAMIDWLLSVDEGEMAEAFGRKGESSEGRGSSAGGSKRREREVEKQPTDERGGKGKGKGKGKSKRREEEAEERHVRRQEQGRSK